MSTPLYFFGCWDSAGHYLFDRRGTSLNRVGPFDVWGSRGLPIDGKFAPGIKEQDESAIALTHVRGWTVLAMWDRSIDTRGGCNAAFLAEGTHTQAEMWALARDQFPSIVVRLKAAS